ncbi:hypothetical protein [Tsuneonella sp. HG222]
MSQVEVSKTVANALLAAPEGSVSVSKTVMYLLLVPGEDEGPTTRQGHVYIRRFRRG